MQTAVTIALVLLLCSCVPAAEVTLLQAKPAGIGAPPPPVECVPARPLVYK